MADYIIKLKGEDNLSNTIKNVKQEIGNLGKQTTQLDNIKDKFDRITNSQMPLRRQLSQIRQLLGKMNLDGLDKTQLFQDMAMRAGEMTDALGDAQNAVNRFASDTFKLDAGIQALQGITAAASIAQGVVGMFGEENQKVQQAILKVQSALAILNGVQSITNMLQHDSALILRIKQIRTEVLTAATEKNTVATAANSAIVKKDTIITNAWNVAKAVSKALLGDFTGLVLLGGTALATYSIYTSLNTDETEKNTKAKKRAIDTQSTYTSTLASSYSSLMGKYIQLREEWKKLSTAQQKIQWIKDNATELQNLGIKYDSVNNVENSFVNNTSNVIKGFEKRAKAAALMAQITENYKKQIELQDKIDKANKQSSDRVKGNGGKPYKAGDKFLGQTYKMGFMPEDFEGGRLTAKGARKANNAVVIANGENTKAAREEIKALEASNNKLVEELAKNTTVTNKVGNAVGGSSNGGGGSTNNTPKAVKGSINSIKEEINALQSQMDNGLIPADKIDSTILKLSELRMAFEKLKSEMDAHGVVVRYEKMMADQGDQIRDTLMKSVRKSDIGSEFTKNIQDQFDKEKDLELKNIPTDKLKEQADEMGDSIKKNSKKSKKEMSEGLVEGIDAVGGAFSAAGNLAKAFGDSTTAAVMQSVAATAQGVATIIPQVMQLIGVKEGEALANGEASAASLPFPSNLVAIATIVSTLISTFATIAQATSGGFASGGVVKGNSYVGDHNLYGLNAGETVLTQSQSASLWAALESGRLGYNRPFSSSDITFKIKGSDLYGALNNYNKIKSKTR